MRTISRAVTVAAVVAVAPIVLGIAGRSRAGRAPGLRCDQRRLRLFHNFQILLRALRPSDALPPVYRRSGDRVAQRVFADSSHCRGYTNSSPETRANAYAGLGSRNVGAAGQSLRTGVDLGTPAP